MQIDAGTAKSVLGDDFLPSDEVLAGSNFAARDGLLRILARRLPDAQTLEWLAENKFVLLPTPFGKGMNSVTGLSDLEEKFPRIKFPPRSVFGDESPRGTRWLAVRKEPYPESMVEFKHGFIMYQSPDLFVPNALVLLYAAAVYFEFRGLSLFGSTYITTSSMSCGFEKNKAHCVHTYIPRWVANTDFIIEATPSWMSERPMQKGMACARMW